MTDHIADDDGHSAVGQQGGVVPVPDERAGFGGGPVDGGGVERPHVRQRRQQQPLERL
ncbi:hypothetical protein [Streptomyces sp. NPDC003480]